MTVSGKTLGDCTIVVEDADAVDDDDEKLRPLVGSQTCVTRETFRLEDDNSHLRKPLKLMEEVNPEVFDEDVALFRQSVSSKPMDFLTYCLLGMQKLRAMVMSSLDFPSSMVD